MQNVDLATLQNLEIIFNSNKAQRRESVKLGELPVTSFQAVLAYGAQRFINDKLGGSDINQEEASAKFDEILNQLKAGWVARQSSGGMSNLEKEVAKLARIRIREALAAKGLTLKEVGKEQVASLVKQYIAQNTEALAEIAQATLEAKAKAVKQASKLDASKLDLTSLGL